MADGLVIGILRCTGVDVDFVELTIKFSSGLVGLLPSEEVMDCIYKSNNVMANLQPLLPFLQLVFSALSDF